MLAIVAILLPGFADIANAFTCQQEGVFKNTDTNDCKSYVVCNSNLVPLVQNCPSNTYYWPEANGCFSRYNCGTSSMPNNKNPCEGFSSLNIPDSSATDCTKYLYCSSIYVYHAGYSTHLPLVQSVTCPSGTLFRNGGCDSDPTYQCINYPCTTEGSFKDPNASSCSTFIACSLVKSWQDSSNTYWNVGLKTCPSGTKFSPFTNKCDALYNCNGIDQYNGIDPCANFNYANPFVPNPLNTDATSYIECFTVPYGDGSVTILERTCPANFYFSPLLGKCYNNYDPNETCSKDPCSSGVGKYIDYKSGMCENFIECRDESKDAASFKPVYEKVYCPPGTRYSPELKECSKQYVCPTFPINYCYPQIPTTTTTTTTPAAAAGK